MYSYALHSRRFTPASVIELEPKKGDPDAEPRRLSLRMGVAKSDNEVAEHVLQEVGAENVVRWAHAMGVNSTLKPTPSLALGAYEVSVFELTNAYTTLASGGTAAAARIITKIEAPDGTTLELPPEPPKRPVMSGEEAYLTTSLLRSVVQEGTARKARELGRPVAGKTGTTNDNRDAWFVGYSTEIVAGTWVGYDDNISLGYGEYGAVAALPAWIEFMKAAHGDRPKTQFSRPPKIVTQHIDPRTGLLPYPDQEDSVLEEFLDGTLPEQVAEPAGEGEETTGEEAGDDTDAVESGADVGANQATNGNATPDPEPPPANDAAAPAADAAPEPPPTLPDAEPPPF
jgi:penicillin-binding protein 1A